MEAFRLIRTRWGWFTVVARGRKLAGTRLPVKRKGDALAEARRAFPEAEYDDQILPVLSAAVTQYFAGYPALFRATLDLAGFTDFQRKIIRAARRIAYGQVCSYGDLAKRIGHAGAARAVGSVMRHNRFPLVVPCHRVVASGGRLGGFSSPGGTAEKHALLALEGGVGALL